MKLNEVYKLINEEIKDNGKRNCLALDLDDTVFKVNSKEIGVWKEEPGKKPIRLSTDEYAKDPDASEHKEWFSYREFRDPDKVFNSIVKGTPILRNLKLMDAHIRANWDVCFLTARGLGDVVEKALREFLMFRDANGNLNPIGDKLKSEISHAVNDMKWVKAYPNAKDPEKKAMVLKRLCKYYDNVKFVDDDLKNIKATKELNIPNLQVVVAQK